MEKFIEFLSEILNVDASILTKNTKYQSIPEWDSLMQIRIVAEIEERYNVDIPIDMIDSLLSINDFYEFINKD